MHDIDLSFASGERSLGVRRFTVHEGISSLFVVSVLAHSTNPSLDLSTLVGAQASLRIEGDTVHAPSGGGRIWSGVCSQMEQLQAEPAGASTYHVRIVPVLWLLTQRRNHRVYQHLSIPDIVSHLLTEWHIEHTWQIDRGQHPRLEYKVQYGETDFAFLSRILQEAGIAFVSSDAEHDSALIFSDAVHAAAVRVRSPLPFVDNPSRSDQQELVTRMRFSQEMRPGVLSIHDFDFRRPGFPLSAEARGGAGIEERLEQIHYRPGAFLIEGNSNRRTPTVDAPAAAEHDHLYGLKRAEQALHAARVGGEHISFETNVVNLSPGTIFSVDHHPHLALGIARPLMVTGQVIHGGSSEDWHIEASAVPADAPYRPPSTAMKPRVKGLQCARVVGAPTEEIYTDEFGRVRVQFPWDRHGKSDDHASCWVRVSQGWGGAGFGMVDLPRVGQEVLVEFVQGDPDQPMVVGQVYNGVRRVPYDLPAHATRSTWKSSSPPDGGGSNEIMFEDSKGDELVFHQAEKDREKLVKHDEAMTIGHDRAILVKNDASERTEGDRRLRIGVSWDTVVKARRKESVEEDSHEMVKSERRVRIGANESLTVVGNRHVRAGESYAISAGKAVHVLAGEELVAEATDVTIAGPGGFIRIDESGITIQGTMVWINDGGEPGMGVGARPREPEE